MGGKAFLDTNILLTATYSQLPLFDQDALLLAMKRGEREVHTAWHEVK
jgi:hypothetical protein